MSPSVQGAQLVAWLTLALGTLCVGTAALVIASRRRFDRHRAVLHAVNDMVEPSTMEGNAGAREEAAIAMLQRAPSGLLWTLASDATVPADLQRLVAFALLGQQGTDRLLRAAGRGTGWRRGAALRGLALSRHPASSNLLSLALQDPSPDVGRATVSVLGQMHDEGAAELLAEALRAGRQPRSRVATALDEFSRPVPHIVAPLLWSDDPQVRFWACALMRRYPEEPGLLERLVTLTSDASAPVRKTAIDTLASLGHARAAQAVALVLDDEVPFVRAHAVRALGALGGLSAASAIADRLSDRDWWVRSAAKQTLEQFGAEVAASVIPMLSHEDRFARNSAAEVLQNIGVHARILAEDARAPGDPLRQWVLRLLAEAGGQWSVPYRGLPETPIERSLPTSRHDHTFTRHTP